MPVPVVRVAGGGKRLRVDPDGAAAILQQRARLVWPNKRRLALVLERLQCLPPRHPPHIVSCQEPIDVDQADGRCARASARLVITGHFPMAWRASLHRRVARCSLLRLDGLGGWVGCVCCGSTAKVSTSSKAARTWRASLPHHPTWRKSSSAFGNAAEPRKSLGSHRPGVHRPWSLATCACTNEHTV
jgi:hypothetical protein